MLSTFARVVNRHTHTPGCLPGCRQPHQHVAPCPRDCYRPDVVTRIKLPCEVCGKVRPLGFDGTCGPCWYAFLAVELGISGPDWLARVQQEVEVRQQRRPNSRYIAPSPPDDPDPPPALVPAGADEPHLAAERIPGIHSQLAGEGSAERHKEGGPPLHGDPPHEQATPTERSSPTAVQHLQESSSCAR